MAGFELGTAKLDASKIMAARRAFLTTAGLAGAAALGTGLLGSDRADAASLTYTDPKKHSASLTDILNFALNLEYLEAEYYLRATTGSGLPESDRTGLGGNLPGKDAKKAGTPGTVTGGSLVPFAVPLIQQVANDIASDEHNHVKLLRTALGKHAVAAPNIDLQSSFTAAAVAAGVITTGQTFNPFLNDDNFLLGAFIFEDVGVTAYHGAAPFIKNAGVLSVAAGLLGTEAYHAGAIRALLASRGQTMASDLSIANSISVLRATADGSGNAGNDAPLTDAQGNAIIAANDASGLVFARTLNEVLNIVYLGAGKAGVGGGFFPNGLNGAIT